MKKALKVILGVSFSSNPTDRALSILSVLLRAVIVRKSNLDFLCQAHHTEEFLIACKVKTYCLKLKYSSEKRLDLHLSKSSHRISI